MDIIDKQVAIDALLRNKEMYFKKFDTDPIDRFAIAIIENDIDTISKLPSAERKGYWIEEDDGIIHGRCSNCGWVSVWQSTDVFGMDYCPSCGARMEVKT